MNNDRLINPTAEAALLGALMLENKLIVQIADRVKQDDFGDALHGRIFTALMRFSAKGMRADAMTLRPLFHHDQDAQYGAYLDELVDAPAVVDAASAIADQVADLAARRAARQVMRDALTALEDDLDRPVDEICSQVETSGWAAANSEGDDVALDASEIIGLVEDRDDRIVENLGAVGMVNKLVDDIDLLLGPLEATTYNLLAGRPGMGKTAVAGSMALGYAMNGHAGVIINLEMNHEQNGIRVAADLGHAVGYKLKHSVLKKGGLSRQDRADLAHIREKAKALPLRWISLKPGTDIKRIWSLVARYKAIWAAAGRKLEFVVIDYLGLISATDSEGRTIDDTRKRMNVVSKSVKRMAAEMDLAVIALAQLSRMVEQRQDKRPMLSDLRDSGDLEQDADSVTMVYRKEEYLRQAEPGRGDRDAKGHSLYEEWEAEIGAVRDKVDLIGAKNRHGRPSSRQCRFLSDYVAVRSGDFDPYGDQPLML